MATKEAVFGSATHHKPFASSMCCRAKCGSALGV